MYYKLTNKESEVYKQLHALRTKELAIEERNEKAIRERFPDWNGNFIGQSGQQNYWRVSQYSGLEFTEPEKIDTTVWKSHNDFPQFFVPYKRTKAGKEIYDFFYFLEKSSLFDLESILKIDVSGYFSFPYLEIVGDVLILLLDSRFEPADENIIEITKREFEELRNQK